MENKVQVDQVIAKVEDKAPATDDATIKVCHAPEKESDTKIAVVNDEKVKSEVGLIAAVEAVVVAKEPVAIVAEEPAVVVVAKEPAEEPAAVVVVAEEPIVVKAEESAAVL